MYKQESSGTQVLHYRQQMALHLHTASQYQPLLIYYAIYICGRPNNMVKKTLKTSFRHLASIVFFMFARETEFDYL